MQKRFVFYSRGDNGTERIGSISPTSAGLVWMLPEWLMKEIISRTMPDGSKFDRHNPEHVAQLPVMYRYSRLFLMIEDINTLQQELVR